MRAIAAFLSLGALSMATPGATAAAGFQDTATVTAGAVMAVSLKPQEVSPGGCEVNIVGLTTSWHAQVEPAPVTYTAVIVETGANLPVAENGSVRSVTIPRALLQDLLASVLLGGKLKIRVQASLPLAGWTAVSTREVTTMPLVGPTCGSWS